MRMAGVLELTDNPSFNSEGIVFYEQRNGAVLPVKPDFANRTSYVIAPTGEIIYSYTDLKPDAHVDNTMAAGKKWQDDHKKS